VPDKALTVHMGAGTKFSGKPTYRGLAVSDDKFRVADHSPKICLKLPTSPFVASLRVRDWTSFVPLLPWVASSKEPWCKILEIATPRLPFVVCAW
jgi:hypothetical protein